MRKSNVKPATSAAGKLAEALLEKHGPKPEGWHADHIVPLSCAKTVEELHRIHVVENIRWVPAKANNSKFNHKTPEGILLHEKLLGRPWED
jgi:hypothetical protein